MAFDAKPSTHFGAGYSVASNSIRFNTNDAASNKTLTTLTDAEADPTTGDYREVVRALLYKIGTDWDATASADRPAKMTFARSLSVESSSGNLVESYMVSFQVGITRGNVAAE
jgi:hypothetical protein